MASFSAEDDPTYDQAMKSNERDQWEDARHAEINNLNHFGVIGEKIPADKVPPDCDIYDTMMVCKRKRGKDNVVTRHKMRCVLCGNQMNASKTVVDLRTQSPTLMHRTFKFGCGVAVNKRARRCSFDVVGAYLQGMYKKNVVYARAPKDCREYDERGVELVWATVRPLYGEPDAGRVWYNTLAYYLMDTEKFVRNHYDPCHFAKTFADGTDLQLHIYVDDGNTWDTNCVEADAFYERLSTQFDIKVVPDDYFLGMDVFSPEPAIIKISNKTYILALVAREFPDGAEKLPKYSSPGDPRLFEYYEMALAAHVAPAPEFGTRYRSLVGGLQWVGPTARPDVLHSTGICARAYTFSTVELYGCAVRILLYLAESCDVGITFSAYTPNPDVLDAATDSDWHITRSTSGGGLRLAGGTAHAVSRKQDCTAGSSAGAEIVAASSLCDDIVHARGLLGYMNLPQSGPTILDVDNKAVYDVSRNYSATKQLRHLDRRAFRIREYTFSSIVAARLVRTSENWADMFTKVLDRTPFLKFRRLVLNTVDSVVARVVAMVVDAWVTV